MFGSYDVPLNLTQEGVSLSIEREGECLLYRRECGEEKVEKILLASNGKLLINPVEPLNKPKEITPYLLIEFERALMIEPKGTKKIFSKFPIEIGVFISANENFEILDIFTMMKQKFTLYGDPRSGIICKYWRSDVYTSLPNVHPMNEGVIEFNIMNTTSKWVELTKSVFNAHGMKIYYSDTMVSVRADVKIRGEETAETDMVDSPLREGMTKSLELYFTKKLSITGTKFVMEVGL